MNFDDLLCRTCVSTIRENTIWGYEVRICNHSMAHLPDASQAGKPAYPLPPICMAHASTWQFMIVRQECRTSCLLSLLCGRNAAPPISFAVVRQECRTSYHLRTGVDGATLRCPSKKNDTQNLHKP